MNNLRTHKIIAFFLAVLMILPVIPTMDLTVFAEGEEHPLVGREFVLAEGVSSYWLRTDPYVFGGSIFAATELPVVMEVADVANVDETLYFLIKAAKNNSWPDQGVEKDGTDNYWWISSDYVSLPLYFLPAGLIAESETVSGTATIDGTSVVVYKSLDNGAAGVVISVVSGTQVTLVTKYTFTTADGTKLVFYRYDYKGDNTDLANAAIDGSGYPFIYAGSLITTPSVIHENNTKVKIKADQTAINLYSDPSTNVSDMVTVDAALLDGIYKISGTYTDVTTNALYYRLECCTHFSWPAGYGMYTYVLSTVVEETDGGIAFPIVDFCNPAPIMSYNSQIQPRSAIYGARSAIARASLYSTDSLLSTAAEGTSSSDALKLSKDVRDNGDGTYTITLEAYTTGTVTVTQTTMPMDIVLVLDQSGSMEYCINCGATSWDNNSTCNKAPVTYTAVSGNDYSSDTEYYIKNGDNYTRVYYCNRCPGFFTQQHHNYYGYHQTPGDVVNEQIYTKSGASHVSRLDALKDAVSAFVTEVSEKAKGPDGVYGPNADGKIDDVYHRIAIVGFASQNSNGYNTEILSISGNNSGNVGVRYNNLDTTHYKNALQDVTTQAGRTMLDNAIDALEAEGATQSNLGMLMAENIYSNNDIDLDKRNRITIMFTDGTPTTFSDYNEGVANGAILSAKTQKNTYGATVYTVGVFDGANASNPTSLPANNTTNHNRENRYMHLVSSNWPTATSMTVTGTINENVTATQSYYMSASSTEALNNIFVAMSNQVGGTPLPLDRTTVVKDIITPQFTLPAKASDVLVFSEKCKAYNEQTGTPTWGGEVEFLNSDDAVTIDTVNHCVDVTGFDFAHNYVAQNGRVEGDDTKEGDFHGRRLVIRFTIKPDPDFLGGDGVATNGTQSGIYSKGEPIAFFPPGSVSVPLKDISTIVKNKHIYYGNITDLTGILDLWAISRDDQKEPLPVDVDGINNAYVNLLYTIKLNDSTVAQYDVPAGEPWGSENCTWRSTAQTQLLQNYQALEDTGFSVECSMISVANTGNVKRTTGSATVYVYKPTLVFKDSEQKYKDSLTPYNADTGIDGFLESHWDEASTVWSHSTQTATPEGKKPEFTFAYTYTNTNAFTGGEMLSTKDVPVSVTVTVNGWHPDETKATPVSGDGIVTIINTATGAYCVHNGCTGLSSGVHFIVHVTQAITSLKIEKEGWNTVDPNQTFLFTVTGLDAEGQQINLTVTVHENGSVTIDGLIIGNEYTITEKTDWSWRYTYGGVDSYTGVTITDATVTNGVKVKLGESGNVITFNNTRDKLQWLDGDSWLDNLFSLFGN